jgi:hypothetical protein
MFAGDADRLAEPEAPAFGQADIGGLALGLGLDRPALEQGRDVVGLRGRGIARRAGRGARAPSGRL